MVTVHAAVPPQPPVKPTKNDFEAGAGDRTTLVPTANAAEHFRGQSIPAGLLDTDPCPPPPT